MEGIIGFLAIFVSIFILCLIVFGLILCRKNHFKEGFYFFLMIFFLKIYDFIAPFTISRFIDSYNVNRTSLPLRMTFGEMIALLSFIPRAIEIIAFIFLVVGLYRIWKSNTLK